MECPDCGKYLHDRAAECVCGWKLPLHNATKRFCDCGEPVHIAGECYECYYSHHHQGHLKMLEEVRSKLKDEKGRSLARMENESKEEYAARCKAWLKSSGAMGRIGRH